MWLFTAVQEFRAGSGHRDASLWFTGLNGIRAGDMVKAAAGVSPGPGDCSGPSPGHGWHSPHCVPHQHQDTDSIGATQRNKPALGARFSGKEAVLKEERVAVPAVGRGRAEGTGHPGPGGVWTQEQGWHWARPQNGSFWSSWGAWAHTARQ